MPCPFLLPLLGQEGADKEKKKIHARRIGWACVHGSGLQELKSLWLFLTPASEVCYWLHSPLRLRNTGNPTLALQLVMASGSQTRHPPPCVAIGMLCAEKMANDQILP